jgi:predicted GIY-YIG superfamily endonuclease
VNRNSKNNPAWIVGTHSRITKGVSLDLWQRRIAYADTLPPYSRTHYYVYGLRCPESGEIRYYGCTNNPRGRWRQHCYAIKGSACEAFILRLNSLDMFAELEIVKGPIDLETASALEHRLIRANAGQLLNRSTGRYSGLDTPEFRKRRAQRARAKRKRILREQQ